MAKAGWPVSYLYNPWFAPTQSQLTDLQFARYNTTNASICPAGRTTTSSGADAVGATLGCANNIGYYRCGTQRIGEMDLKGFLSLTTALVDDDGVTAIGPSKTYSRLKEGIERFMITDINNPGAASVAQSTVFVMWDAVVNSMTAGSGTVTSDGQVRFNHIPGGGNVLYMDGHVSFIRVNEKIPYLFQTGGALSPLSLAGSPQTSNGVTFPVRYVNSVGLWGGQG